MKVLITGAQGQVGRSLIKVLTGHSVTAYSKNELDITHAAEISAALEKSAPDVVINAAAYTAVDEAESRPVVAYEINENGPLALAIATASREIPLVHFSTDYVFDGKASAPYFEDAPTNPQSVYAKSKLAGEIAVMNNNPDHYIIRTAWVYHEVGKNFPNTILSLANKPEVRVVNDQTGSPTYAPHLAEAVIKLIEKWPSPGVYHLAGSGQTTWYELTRALYKRMGIHTPVIPVSTSEFPRPAKRPSYAVLGSSKLPDIALPPWEHGLDEFVKQIMNMQKGKIQ
jgi:dTDP-4-dehydrorhamnose reductase